MNKLKMVLLSIFISSSFLSQDKPEPCDVFLGGDNKNIFCENDSTLYLNIKSNENTIFLDCSTINSIKRIKYQNKQYEIKYSFLSFCTGRGVTDMRNRGGNISENLKWVLNKYKVINNNEIGLKIIIYNVKSGNTFKEKYIMIKFICFT